MTAEKSFLKRVTNRILHRLAKSSPGATTLRPSLHRWRGVKIGRNVFIGDEVYLENEYPDCVEIGDDVQISLRTIILAHTRGKGRVVIERDAYIGPNVVISCPGTGCLRIGAGAVISAGCVVTRDIPPGVLISNHPPHAVATVRVSLSKAQTFEEFVRGLRPIRAEKHGQRPVATHDR